MINNVSDRIPQSKSIVINLGDFRMKLSNTGQEIHMKNLTLEWMYKLLASVRSLPGSPYV